MPVTNQQHFLTGGCFPDSYGAVLISTGYPPSVAREMDTFQGRLVSFEASHFTPADKVKQVQRIVRKNTSFSVRCHQPAPVRGDRQRGNLVKHVAVLDVPDLTSRFNVTDVERLVMTC